MGRYPKPPALQAVVYPNNRACPKDLADMAKLVPLVSRLEIAHKVKSIAEKISADYRDKDLVAIGILNGAFIFLADLVRELTIPVVVDFVRLASYGFETSSTGIIRITKDIERDIANKHALIVDDIIDTGYTVAYLIDHLKKLKPASIKVCAFIDNIGRRRVNIPIDYIGCKVQRGFLVGYGLDCGEKYRTLPEIYEIHNES